MNEILIPLVEQYPQITEVLLSENFKKFVDNRLYVYKLYRQYERDEVINQVYEEFAKAVKVRRYKDTGKLSAWCRQTAQNIIRSLARKQKLKEVAVDSNALDYITGSLEEITVYENTFLTLHQALSELDLEDREILTLHFLENLKYQEIFERLSSKGSTIPSVEAIRKRVQRAKDKLRKVYVQKVSQV